MDQARIKRWERFYRDVVMRGSEWPRELWLAAVGDALTAALPEDSALPGDFRRTAAELQNLDRTNRGSYLEERRMGQLEAQIQHLIGTADHVIRGPRRGAAALDAADDDEDLPEPRPARWNIGADLITIGPGASKRP